jgi:hypothetical protein
MTSYVTDPNGLMFCTQDSFSALWKITHKLFRAEHESASIFKIALIGRLIAETGIIPSEYKKLTEKVMLGAGLAALTLPGSGSLPSGNRSGGSEGTTLKYA